MQITLSLTEKDMERLQLPISVSRILKEAVRLLESDAEEINADAGVTAGYLSDLEPLLNRLFQQVKNQAFR